MDAYDGSMEPPEAFTHQPISANEIRLLRILQAEDEVDTICCMLAHFERSRCPKYEALSYTWGDLNDQEMIYCNNKTLHVTAGCHSALKALRQRRKEDLPATADWSWLVWIDAICIDQTNDAEKTAQVARMSSVYSQAGQTVIYLGDPDEASALMDCLFVLSWDPHHKGRDPFSYDGGRKSLREWKVAFYEHLLDYLKGQSDLYEQGAHKSKVVRVDDGLWTYFFENVANGNVARHWNIFFSRPWFSRTWIVQEIMLSRHIVLLVGSAELPWRLLGSSLTTIRSCGMEAPGSLPGLAHHPTLLSDGAFPLSLLNVELPQIVSMRMNTGLVHGGKNRQAVDPHAYSSVDNSQLFEYQSGLKLWRLLQLLKITCNFQCRDPRDKLFALVALFERPIPALLTPDYSKSVAEVFTDLTWFLIRYDTPEMLPLAGLEQCQDLVPSWVVNWTFPRELQEDLDGEDLAEHDKRAAGFTSGQKRMIARRHDNVLVLRGVMVEQIEQEPTELEDWIDVRPDSVECIVVFLGVREVYRLRSFEDGWKLIGLHDAPNLMNGEAVKDVDWESVDSEVPTAPLRDFKLH